MLTPRQQHCLHGIGIRLWQPRPSAEETADDGFAEAAIAPPEVSSPPPPAIAEPVPATPAVQKFVLSDWPATLQAIESCHNCQLADSCTRKVPGKGFEQAELMIIGEAPGHEEDRQGKPFVGRAGQLLDRMLQAIDIDPGKVYITNILKCRPPNNRDPRPEEVIACSQFLRAQIELVQPRVIFSVGRVSAQNLLKNQTPVGKLRGQSFVLPDTDIPLRVTYHPAYLLRNPADKAKVWQDLKALRQILQSADNASSDAID